MEEEGRAVSEAGNGDDLVAPPHTVTCRCRITRGVDIISFIIVLYFQRIIANATGENWRVNARAFFEKTKDASYAGPLVP